MTKKKTFDNFNEFNVYLIQNFMDLKFIEYVENIHHSLFRHIKLQTIKFLLSLNEQNDEYCIDEIILQTYSLINNINDKKSIEELINNNNLIHDKDYRVRKKNNKENKQLELEYKFTPYAFKKILLSSNNLYIELYLVLEKSMFYYNIYQNKLKQALNAVVNVKLDKIYDELKNNKFISIANDP
jgi:hypothetical protein